MQSCGELIITLFELYLFLSPCLFIILVELNTAISSVRIKYRITGMPVEALPYKL